MSLATLSELPIIGGLFRWIAMKRRLFVEYLLLAMFIMFAGLSFALWYTRKEVKAELALANADLIVVNNRLTTQEFINDTQNLTIDNLRNLRQIDNDALASLLGEFDSLSKTNKTVRSKLQELEKTNEAVRNLRNQPLPPELGCLLEPRSCQD